MATIDATSTQALSAFNLDLRRLRVWAVTVDGAPAGFAQAGGELTVTPGTPIGSGKHFQVSVAYGGKPKPRPDGHYFPTGWIRTKNGAFVLSEPVGSPTWFPCNDHPSDKASYRITVTVPKRLKAISNGALESISRHGGATSFVWNETEPMVTYLATVAIGRFKLRRSLAAGVPSLVALDPSIRGRNRKVTVRAMRKIPDILNLFGSHFGTYPFSTTGAIVDNDPKFFMTALETQTRPLFPRPFPFYFTGVLSHELSHEWFGDAVSIERWSDIWLNEGFATWAEWMWNARASDSGMQLIFRLVFEDGGRELWRVPPGAPGRKKLFGASVYYRGGLALEALRQMIGTSTFLSILQTWVAEHKYGNATTEQFIALAEAKSGRSLAHFFDVWLYQPRKPRNWAS